jgi:hypothetical protein
MPPEMAVFCLPAKPANAKDNWSRFLACAFSAADLPLMAIQPDAG